MTKQPKVNIIFATVKGTTSSGHRAMIRLCRRVAKATGRETQIRTVKTGRVYFAYRPGRSA